jgi:hypothetical protein
MKKLFTLVLIMLFSALVGQAQIQKCFGGDPTQILCYGDFEIFSNTYALNQSLVKGVYFDNNSPFNAVSLIQDTFNNPSKFVLLTGCPSTPFEVNGVIYGEYANQVDGITFPLKRSFDPGASGVFEFEMQKHIMTAGFKDEIRVHFTEKSAASYCQNSDFNTSTNLGHKMFVDIEPVLGEDWLTTVENIVNTTNYSYNYVTIEYRAAGINYGFCKNAFFDNFKFKLDAPYYKPSVSLLSGTPCDGDRIFDLKGTYNNGPVISSNLQWEVVAVNGNPSSNQSYITSQNGDQVSINATGISNSITIRFKVLKYTGGYEYTDYQVVFGGDYNVNNYTVTSDVHWKPNQNPWGEVSEIFISGTLTIPANVKLEITDLKLLFGENGKIEIESATSGKGGELVGIRTIFDAKDLCSNNPTWKGISVNGIQPSNTSISYQDDKQGRIILNYDCEINHSSYVGIFSIDGGILDVTSTNFTGNATAIRFYSNRKIQSASEIDNCNFNFTKASINQYITYGIILNYQDEIEIRGCKFTNYDAELLNHSSIYKRGVGIQATNSNIRVENSNSSTTLFENLYRGIHARKTNVSDQKDLEIYNTHIKNCKEGIVLELSGSGYEIKGNRIESNSINSTYGILSNDAQKITITNNTIIKCNEGIRLNNSCPTSTSHKVNILNNLLVSNYISIRTMESSNRVYVDCNEFSNPNGISRMHWYNNGTVNQQGSMIAPTYNKFLGNVSLYDLYTTQGLHYYYFAPNGTYNPDTKPTHRPSYVAIHSKNAPYECTATIRNGIQEEASIESITNDGMELKNFPNPFNSSTTIEYNLGDAFTGNLQIMDLQGRVIYTTVLTDQEGRVVFEKNYLKAGVYVCTIKTNNNTVKSIRMIVQ